MKVLFFGLGSIGRRHARLLHDRHGAEILALRSRKGPDREAPSFAREVSDWSPGDVDAVFITNPTHLHARTALECIRRGARRLFVEKPIDSDRGRLRKLRSAAKRAGASIYVGYCLRFHPVLQALRARLEGRRLLHIRAVSTSWLPDWRPSQDYRDSYSASASRGGGVLLDLSHELDYVEYLSGREIREIAGRARNSRRLQISAEDEADLQLTLADGTPVALHLSFSSRSPERRVQVDFDGGYLEGDLLAGRLTETGASGRPRSRTFPLRPDAMYEAQLEHFLKTPAARMAATFDRQASMTDQLLRFRDGVSR